MEGLYRVYYTTRDGDGFYAINAVDEQDALQHGKRLSRNGYGDAAKVTHARLLRPALFTPSYNTTHSV